MPLKQSFCYPLFLEKGGDLNALFFAAAKIGYPAVEWWFRDEQFEELVAIAHSHGLTVASICGHGSIDSGLNVVQKRDHVVGSRVALLWQRHRRRDDALRFEPWTDLLELPNALGQQTRSHHQDDGETELKRDVKTPSASAADGQPATSPARGKRVGKRRGADLERRGKAGEQSREQDRPECENHHRQIDGRLGHERNRAGNDLGQKRHGLSRNGNSERPSENRKDQTLCQYARSQPSAARAESPFDRDFLVARLCPDQQKACNVDAGAGGD